MVEPSSSPSLLGLDLPQAVEKNSLLEGRKRKRKKSKNSTPKQEIVIKEKDRRTRSDCCRIVNRNKLLLARCGKKVFKAHFIKKFYSEIEMDHLLQVMDRSGYWEDRIDCRGDRQTLITGTWNAQGLSRAGIDPLHPAGKGGQEELMNGKGELNTLLAALGERLTNLIMVKRPDVYELLLDYKATQADFGIFSLFMAPRGSCGMHNDRNDVLSVVLGIQTPKKGLFLYLSFLLFFSYSFLNLF
jgi:hypothetical protein